jgi:uncharacterized membrane protein YqjE
MAVEPEGPEVIEPRVKAERSLATLLSDLAGETVELFRQELALFKAELQEKLNRAGSGAAALAAAALIAFSAWLFLLLAAVFALAIVVPLWAAALIVGVLVLVIAGVLALYGRNRLRADALTPERTLRSLREDRAWIRERGLRIAGLDSRNQKAPIGTLQLKTNPRRARRAGGGRAISLGRDLR